ncbi:MAG: hypothetical protein IID52_08990 [Proteobacteria bacterium]|nr:hypothetical protein [Pseudomonadota bacterium]
MLRAILHAFLIILISAAVSPLQAQDDYFIGDFICDEAQEGLDVGEEYTTLLETPLALAMATAIVHINRIEAGADLDRGDGCALAVVGLEDGDEIIIYKFRDISGEFASRYHFIIERELEADRTIALNTFADLDAIAHELGYIPEGVRLYNLEAISPETIATHYFFAGEPSVNQLIDYVLVILNDREAPPVQLDLTGEEPTIIFREDLLEGDE